MGKGLRSAGIAVAGLVATLAVVCVDVWRVTGHSGAPVAVAAVAGLLGLACAAWLGRALWSMSGEVEASRHAALVDPLTGLGNARAFAEAVRSEVNRAHRYTMPVSLALLEVENHEDRVLADLVRRGMADLLSSRRDGDQAFRVSENRFALVLPHATLHTTHLAVNRLVDGAQRNLYGAKLRVGISTFVGEDADALVPHAEQALRAAAVQGQQSVAVFPDFNSSMQPTA